MLTDELTLQSLTFKLTKTFKDDFYDVTAEIIYTGTWAQIANSIYLENIQETSEIKSLNKNVLKKFSIELKDAEMTYNQGIKFIALNKDEKIKYIFKNDTLTCSFSGTGILLFLASKE